MEHGELVATAEKLTHTIEQLTIVLDDEIDGIYTRKSADLARIYQTKTRLLADYAAGIGTLRNTAGAASPHTDLPAPISARLRQKSNLLAEAMERNMKALKVAHEASRQVVDVIIDAVKQQRRTGAAYGKDRNGGLVVNGGDETSASAVTLDTRL